MKALALVALTLLALAGCSEKPKDQKKDEKAEQPAPPPPSKKEQAVMPHFAPSKEVSKDQFKTPTF